MMKVRAIPELTTAVDVRPWEVLEAEVPVEADAHQWEAPEDSDREFRQHSLQHVIPSKISTAEPHRILAVLILYAVGRTAPSGNRTTQDGLSQEGR